MDDGKVYSAYPLKTGLAMIPRKSVTNYYPKGRGLSLGCLALTDVPLALYAIPSSKDGLVEPGEEVEPMAIEHSPVIT